jgi:Transglycosylase SLT domain
VGRTRTRRRLNLAGPGCGCILLHLLVAVPAIAQSPPIVQSPPVAQSPPVVQIPTVAQSPSIVQPTGDVAPPNESACEQAGRQAERAHDLPAGLLLAIGRVEGGRWDARLGRVVPWPWAVDAAGDGTLLDSKQAAIARTTAVRDAGTRNVDVGCYQINLASHPLAFTDLDQAFDPVANADYAARFLAALYAHLGNWNDAVAAYHSAQPELGTPYRQHVFANWPSDNHAATTAATNVQSGPLVVQFASGARVSIWTPSGASAVAETLAITPLASTLPRVFTGIPTPPGTPSPR